MLLLPDASWSQTPYFQLRDGSNDNQSLCQDDVLTPIYYDVIGDNVKGYSITRITKQGIDVTPDLDNIPGVVFDPVIDGESKKCNTINYQWTNHRDY